MNAGLDIRTLAFFSGIIMLLLAGSMLHFRRSRRVYPGFGCWAAASACSGIACFLVGFRYQIPDFLSIIVANAMGPLYYILIAMGMDRFSETKRSSTTFNVAVAVVMILAIIPLTYVRPSINLRIVIASLAMFTIAVAIISTSVRSLRSRFPGQTGALTTAFVLMATLLFLRLVGTALFEERITDFLAAGVLHQITFVVGVVLNVTIIFTLLVLTGERLRDDIIATNTDLEQALAEVKTLRGIIPICAGCKNIRNDAGYYETVEDYLHRHSDAAFSHTLCPDCISKTYPEIHAEIEEKRRQ